MGQLWIPSCMRWGLNRPIKERVGLDTREKYAELSSVTEVAINVTRSWLLGIMSIQVDYLLVWPEQSHWSLLWGQQNQLQMNLFNDLSE